MKRVILVACLLGFFKLSAQEIKDVVKAFESSYTLENEGEYKKASDVIKEIYDENSYEINLRLGWLTYSAGLFNESISHYTKALELMPYSEEVKFGLVYPVAAIGKWDEVIALYDKILIANPMNTTANYRLGLIYYGRDDYQKAYDYFRRVVELYPFGYDALLMYAWANLKLGKVREAKVLFYKVLMSNPDDASAIEGLSYIK